ncbi:MAG: hypothetical protein AB1603_03535, partial [Chloroflexota bacterium]
IFYVRKIAARPSLRSGWGERIDAEDLVDHALIQKAKRAKGKAITLSEYGRWWAVLDLNQ